MVTIIRAGAGEAGLALLERPDLDPESRNLAAMRVEESRRVIHELDPPADDGKPRALADYPSDRATDGHQAGVEAFQSMGQLTGASGGPLARPGTLFRPTEVLGEVPYRPHHAIGFSPAKVR